METDHHHLQALIQETAALNCDDPCFLGRILSPNPPAVYWVREILNQAWKFALPFDVVTLPEEKFLFTVHDASHVTKIMENGPLNIKGALLILKPWPPELTADEVDLLNCSFWVQVHGLPFQNLTAVNAI
jgi:hypothetical protein